MKKIFIFIGSFILLSIAIDGSQLELKGGYDYWRESSNHSSSFDQGGSLGAEILFNSLSKPLDYGLGIEWKSEFSGGGNNTSLGETSSNAYPIYLTAKYDLYKDIYAIGRVGWTIFDDKDINDGFYGAIGVGKKFGKWSLEALYESIDTEGESRLYNGERVEVGSIKIGYRFGEHKRYKNEEIILIETVIEEVIIEKREIVTFNPVIVSVDYAVDSTKTNVLNEKVLANIVNDLEGKSGVLEVRGYTDNSGSNEYNKKLSYERAKNIAEELVDSIPYSQIIKNTLEEKNERVQIKIVPLGKGESNFITDNSTSEKRKRNRRVEIHFFEETD